MRWMELTAASQLTSSAARKQPKNIEHYTKNTKKQRFPDDEVDGADRGQPADQLSRPWALGLRPKASGLRPKALGLGP